MVAAGGTAVAVELVTGTFYLLMLAIGLAAGALAAHVGARLDRAAGRRRRRRRRRGGGLALTARQPRRTNPPPRPTATSTSTSARRVHVDAWKRDGTAAVNYRGANWTARPAPGAVLVAGAASRRAKSSATALVVEQISQNTEPEDIAWKSHSLLLRHRRHLRRPDHQGRAAAERLGGRAAGQVPRDADARASNFVMPFVDTRRLQAHR